MPTSPWTGEASGACERSEPSAARRGCAEARFPPPCPVALHPGDQSNIALAAHPTPSLPVKGRVPAGACGSIPTWTRCPPPPGRGRQAELASEASLAQLGGGARRQDSRPPAPLPSTPETKATSRSLHTPPHPSPSRGGCRPVHVAQSRHGLDAHLPLDGGGKRSLRAKRVSAARRGVRSLDAYSLPATAFGGPTRGRIAARPVPRQLSPPCCRRTLPTVMLRRYASPLIIWYGAFR